MDTAALLAKTSHRPFELPNGQWRMTHVWHDLLFLHWRVEPRQLRGIVPPALEIDTFDGAAWLAVVPFWMSGIRLRGLPAIPCASGFAELNVRTYVRYRGRPGVYFMSLDAPHRLLSWIARRWYHLPYRAARISLRRSQGLVEFHAQRVDQSVPAAAFHARYRPTQSPFEPARDSLACWLVERYRLYTTDRFSRLWSADIHHRPWHLQAAEVEIESNTMPASHGLGLPGQPALAHYAGNMEVLVWPPQLQAPFGERVELARCGSGKSRYKAALKSVTIE